MMNNQNTLLHSPFGELANLKKKIQSQQQKIVTNQQKIKELKAKIQATRQRNLQKRQKLAQVHEKLIKQKLKGEQFQSSLSQSDSEKDAIQKANQTSNVPFDSSSPIINQLRQHFKALRMQMLGQLVGSDQNQEEYQDQVDVDNMSYQQLLQLGQKIGKVSKGLDSNKIKSLQVKKYQPKNSQPIQCAICKDQLNKDDQCIELHCRHVFHNQCIKGWLSLQKHCPNCKRDITVIGSNFEKKQLPK